MFHDKAGPVHETFDRLREHLERAGIDYVVIGAFALDCFDYMRATTDIDLCLRPEDIERFRAELAGETYERVPGTSRRFRDPASDVTFDFLISGELAGRVSRNPEIRFPDPSEAVILKGVRTVSLARLIELKLVTWRGRDWTDVIELIRSNGLGEDFARQLHPRVQMAYLQCFDQKGEEDRYAREA